MKQSNSTMDIFAALASAQAEFPAIPRSRTVTVTGSKGSYKFSYAPFEDILRHVKPTLAKYGLGYTQGADSGKLVTVITHKSGEWLSHEAEIINAGGSAQGYGSALTYARRYGFCGAFGIQADDDDDGNAADGNTITQSASKVTNPLTEMKQDAFDSLPEDEKEFLRKAAANVAALLDERRDAEAHGFLENQHLDTEEKLAIWLLFNSKQRSALKAAGETARLQKKAEEKARVGAH